MELTELTKEQEKIIDRYRRLPGFMQVRRFHDLNLELLRAGNLKNGENSLILYNNTSRRAKIKLFQKVISGIWGADSDTFKEVITDFNTFSLRDQEKAISRMSEINIGNIINSLSPELQMKYAPILIRNRRNLYNISLLHSSVKKAYINEILEAFGDNAFYISKVFEFIPNNLKERYFNIFMQTGNVNVDGPRCWGCIDETTQRKYIGEILRLYNSGKITYIISFWNATSEKLQEEYLQDFMDVNKEIRYSFWMNTPDIVQNSMAGKRFIYSLSKSEREELFIFTNSKLQSELIANAIRSDIGEDYSYDSSLAYYLRNAKPKVYEMNFNYLFRNLSSNIVYLEKFLSDCSDEIKEENSSTIGKYFSRNMKAICQGDLAAQKIFVEAAQYIDSESCAIIIENFYEKNFDKIKDKEGNEGTYLIESFCEKIRPENQKEVFEKLLANDKLKNKLDTIFNHLQISSEETEIELLSLYFEKYVPDKKDSILQKYETIRKKK